MRGAAGALRVAAVQHDIVWHDRDANFEHLSPMIAGAVASGARVVLVTETAPPEIVIQEALAVIDQALGTMQNRELVASDEVADLLLDLRVLLATVPQPVPVPSGV